MQVVFTDRAHNDFARVHPDAQTQVLVENGQTAVIAGLTETQRTQERAGIPILMDLPVLGNLFRRTSNEEVQRDLLIMVTPYIIRN